MKSHGAARRILLVEDEELVRDLAMRLLNRGGFLVTALSDGASGWQTFRSHPDAFDLVLLDVRLPRLSGAVLGRRIQDLRPRQRILFTSGLGHRQLCEDGVLNDRDEFVAKPFTPGTLLGRIRALLEPREDEAEG